MRSVKIQEKLWACRHEGVLLACIIITNWTLRVVYRLISVRCVVYVLHIAPRRQYEQYTQSRKGITEETQGVSVPSVPVQEWPSVGKCQLEQNSHHNCNQESRS